MKRIKDRDRDGEPDTSGHQHQGIWWQSQTFSGQSPFDNVDMIEDDFETMEAAIVWLEGKRFENENR